MSVQWALRGNIKGPTGLQGPQGVKGDTGAQGIQGSQGPQGPTGATGAPGADSTVPGPQGPAGPVGPEGPQGPKGDTGAQGIQGPQGVKGDTGDTGPAGPAGAGSPADAAPLDVSFTAAAVGTSTDFAREDHVHKSNPLLATLLNPPRARLYRATVLACVQGFTTITGMTTAYSGGGITVSASRITVPIAGVYLLNGQVGWSTAAATANNGTRRGIRFVKNGTTEVSLIHISPGPAAVLVQTGVTTTAQLALNANDFIEMSGYHDAASPPTFTGDADGKYTFLEARWVAPL
jgi:hypothetical protein